MGLENRLILVGGLGGWRRITYKLCEAHGMMMKGS